MNQQTQYQKLLNYDKSITIIKIEIFQDDDGLEIGRGVPFAKLICPGDDYSEEDADTQKICNAIWDAEVIAEYQSNQNIILDKIQSRFI